MRRSPKKKKDMKRRSRIDFIGDILEAANESNGTNSSMIMYKASLSYVQLKNYLKTLTEMDLLSYDKDTRTFKTTEKGLRFLNSYNRIYDVMKMIPSPGQQTTR